MAFSIHEMILQISFRNRDSFLTQSRYMNPFYIKGKEILDVINIFTQCQKAIL